jgi:putative ABC transport system substrate-binding protein
MMDRRTVIKMVAGSLLVAPMPAAAQQTGSGRRIGILTAGTITSDWPLFVGLRERGWIEGQNIVIERRSAGGKAELVPGFAEELVQLRLDVIVATGAVASLAAKNATTTIPLVTITGDPVLIGLVPSMSRPGGNITGTSTVSPELAKKRLELLRELRPTAKRIGELVDPANPYFRLIRKDNEQIYRTLGMEPLFVDVANATQLESAIAEVAALRADALIVRSDPLFVSNRGEIANLALKHALPTMAEGIRFASAGCLASYDANFVAMGRTLAVFVDKILRGAKPGDLPIEQPTKYDFVINLKTAKALGLTISPSLLLRADEVIQ